MTMEPAAGTAACIGRACALGNILDLEVVAEVVVDTGRLVRVAREEANQVLSLFALDRLCETEQPAGVTRDNRRKLVSIRLLGCWLTSR